MNKYEGYVEWISQLDEEMKRQLMLKDRAESLKP